MNVWGGAGPSPHTCYTGGALQRRGTLSMQIHTIDCFDRRDVERFVDVPFHLYRDTPQWVPPLRKPETEKLFQRQHPFFQHSTENFRSTSDMETMGMRWTKRHRTYKRTLRGQGGTLFPQSA